MLNSIGMTAAPSSLCALTILRPQILPPTNFPPLVTLKQQVANCLYYSQALQLRLRGA